MKRKQAISQFVQAQNQQARSAQIEETKQAKAQNMQRAQEKTKVKFEKQKTLIQSKIEDKDVKVNIFKEKLQKYARDSEINKR